MVQKNNKCHMLTLLIFIIFSLASTLPIVESAVAAHSHSHNRHSSKEREQDGAYSPKVDQHHYAGGQHHNEFDHEAILGSVKEAEEFDNMPPEEAKAKLRVLVEKMDLNNDNVIEKNELKAWILRSFRMLAEEESKERFHDTDENDDRKISWNEYMEETYGIADTDFELRGAIQTPFKDLEEQRMVKDDKTLFDAADKNKDGYLDATEFVTFTHPEEDPSVLDILLNQTLEEKDLNRDGYLDFKEYIGDRGQDKDTEWLKEEKSTFDMDHDKNGDGLLDRQEILSWVIPSNSEIADEEVEHLFSSADDDQDDILSFEEIVDHHDIFVGSEVTDYGDHLQNLGKFTDEL